LYLKWLFACRAAHQTAKQQADIDTISAYYKQQLASAQAQLQQQRQTTALLGNKLQAGKRYTVMTAAA
jgi:L-amino acid N-acyltransferase YncA